MSGIRQDWFATPIWYFDHPDPAALHRTLLRTIREERERDHLDLSGRSSLYGWHSSDDLHWRLDLHELVSFIESCGAEAARSLNWDLSLVRLALGSCWATVSGQGASTRVHRHPQSELSGIYHFQAPERCGDLFFLNPCMETALRALPLAHATPWTVCQGVYPLAAGRLHLFPGWLHRGVEVNQSEQDRVCISFTLDVRWRSAAVNGHDEDQPVLVPWESV